MPAWLPCLSTLRRLFTAQYLSFDNDGVFTGNPNRGKPPPVPAPRPRPCLAPPLRAHTRLAAPRAEAASQGADASGVAGPAHLAERIRPAERR
eukprot:scaffold120107_cov75-Phaeocystis_antarctica.AAC.5